MKQKITFIFAFLFFSLYSFGQTLGQTFAVNGINYHITKATLPYEVAVSSNTTFVGMASLPASVTNAGNSFAVTSIAGNAFISCTGLTSVTIPNSVTSIGFGAFERCSSLTSVTIPNSVTAIGFGVFIDCSNLTSVTISNSLLFIHSSTFLRCSSLTSVDIPNSVTSISTSAFADCSSLTMITIPNSVTSIGDSAFLRCTSLTTVAIPNSVTSIGYAAFTDCSSLTSITIPSSVTSIAADTFRRCTSLASVAIPNTVTSIGSNTFADCSSLTSIMIPNSVTSIADFTFLGCAGLTLVEIPNSVRSIGFSAFSNCTSLTSVDIPNSVTSIGGSAFANCSNLITVTIPNSVINLGNSGSAFADCSSLTTVTIPDSVRDIAANTFLRCTSLTSVHLPNSLRNIEASAFAYCSNLTTVTIPNAVTSIADNAFLRCVGLTSVTVNLVNPIAINSNVFGGVNLSTVTLNVPAGRVATYDATLVWTNFNPIVEAIVPLALNQTFAANGISYIITKATLPYEVAVSNNPTFVGAATIPASVTNAENSFAVTGIAENAFIRCIGLTSVTIPNSVTSIGNFAFSKCLGLTSFTLGNSVTSIGQEAFSQCTGLTSASIPNSVTNIGNGTFSECTRLTSITIPNSVTSIGAGAFSSCSGLTSVTFPNSITVLNRAMFSGCSSLLSVIIPNSVTSIGDSAFIYSGITSVTIPNSVTSIDYSAFYGCRGLTSVIIPNSVTSIGAEAFSQCTGLTSVSIPNSITSIAYGTFLRCISLTSVSIPNSVTSIGEGAFYQCSGLTSVTIPNSVTSIGRIAFGFCIGLAAVTVDWQTPLPINANVFETLTLSSVTLDVPFGTIAAYDAAAVWTNFGTILETIATPVVGQTFVVNGINYIVTKATLPYEVAVSSNTNFVGVASVPATVPSLGNSFTVTSISGYAFANCTTLTSVRIPITVTSISDSVFYGCTNLRWVTIPNTLTSIGDSAFYGCTSLISVTIPNTVTTISDGAFYGCTGLRSVSVSWASPLLISTTVFLEVNISAIRLTFPIGSEALYEAAVVWTDFNTSLQYTAIPDENFEQALFDEGIDTINGDHQVLTSAITGLTILDLNNRDINDLTGIQDFINLQTLRCNQNGLFQLNVSALTNLQELECANNQLFDLNLSELTSLHYLDCTHNQLFELNLSGLSSLQSLNITYNQVMNLDLTELSSLQNLDCGSNQLTEINVSGLTNLQQFSCPDNFLPELDVSGLTNLLYLNCANNSIANLNVSELTNLQYLDCSTNQLMELNLNGLTSLINLDCYFNSLTNLDISGQTNLQSLQCANNELTNLNASGLTSLQILNCAHNHLTNLNVSGSINLNEFDCTFNNLRNLDLRGVGNVNNYFGFKTAINPSLPCISVDNVDTVSSNFDKDATTIFSTNCNLSIVNYCKGAIAEPLVAPFVAGSTLKWYTVATGGTASLIAPTPLTTTVGTKNYYVSQVVRGVESERVIITVNVNALPISPGVITGTAAQGALVGTTTTANYSIAAVSGATSYLWTSPAGVTIVDGQGTNSITVNFNDVSAGAGAIGNLTVQSVNASGCNSVVRKLALTKALPPAPSKLVLSTPPSSTPKKELTNISKYIGTTTPLTLTAATVATATSYDWELPTGVNRTDAEGPNSTLPSITVNFSGVNTSNTFSYTTTGGLLTYVLRMGVKAKNGVGVSVSNNGTLVNPTTTSAAKQLTLTAVRPAAVTTVTGQITGLCGGNSYTYTITDTALASSYLITTPIGSTVTSASNPTNSGNLLSTTDLSFSVTYPVGFIINASTALANKTITITSVNSIGNSLANKVITLSSTMPAVASVSGGPTYSSCDQTFTIQTLAAATTYTWIVPTGATIVSGQNTNTVVVNYGSLRGNQTIKVKTTNSCGVSSLIKSLALTFGSCPALLKQNESTISLINRMELYPNPTSSLLSIETTNNTTIDKVVVIDLVGKVIFDGKPENNQINVERYSSGTYIIKAFSGEEQFTSKFVKQ